MQSVQYTSIALSLKTNTCLINRFDKRFDLHFTRSSVNHLTSNLKRGGEKIVMLQLLDQIMLMRPLLHETQQTGRWIVLKLTLLFTGRNFNMSFQINKEKKKMKTETFLLQQGLPPLYCCPPPLHPGSPVSLAQEGSQAETEKYININTIKGFLITYSLNLTQFSSKISHLWLKIRMEQ